MKHTILPLLLLGAALLGGCATPRAAMEAPTRYNEPGTPTTEYPRSGKAGHAYDYARGQSGETEYAEAARWFEQAAGQSPE